MDFFFLHTGIFAALTLFRCVEPQGCIAGQWKNKVPSEKLETIIEETGNQYRLVK